MSSRCAQNQPFQCRLLDEISMAGNAPVIISIVSGWPHSCLASSRKYDQVLMASGKAHGAAILSSGLGVPLQALPIGFSTRDEHTCHC